MAVQSKRWTRAEYDRLIAAGALEPGLRLQLVDGAIVEMTPQSAAHAAAVELVHEALRRVAGEGSRVRVQLPLALGQASEPEPDLAVVSGTPRDHWEAHPARAHLVVEIADATLDYDRTVKQAVHASAGIPEYWLLSLPDRTLEVYRDPAGAPAAPRVT